MAWSGTTGYGCALLAAGAVKCWGRNDQGQLGVGSTTDQTNPQGVTLGAGACA